MRTVAAVAVVLALAGPAAAEPVPSFLAHPRDAKKRVEVYVAMPAGKTGVPAVVLVHGHSRDRKGALAMVEGGDLETIVERGWAAVAVSMPGYGRSDGPSDYCGPFTQEAILAAVRHARSLPGVDGKRVALVGLSRGAVAAAMAATGDGGLAGLVLVSPIYDLRLTYERMQELGKSTPEARAVVDDIVAQAGTDGAAFAARSPLAAAGKIRAPTLIVAGGKDPRIALEEPNELAARIAEHKVTARALVYPELGHSIPDDLRDSVVMPFLEKRLEK